ncbi:MAG: aminoglycoside phosphotransferase family protein [Geminicoccaceae bacterium]
MRDSQRQRFLDACGWGDAAIRPLAADASFRCYYRLQRGTARAVLMDAPPPHEDIRPFVNVAGLLHAGGLSAPHIEAADAETGFVLLEDLGDDLFSGLINAGADPLPLYEAAVDVLAALKNAPATGLDAYDATRYSDEADLLPQWYAPAVLGEALPDEALADYRSLWLPILQHARIGAPVLVLRDYHVDNLIWLPDRAGAQRVGLLDFQDAVTGPCAYDLASLLEDARRDVDAAMADDMIARFATLTAMPDRQALQRACTVLAAQRHAKVIGIFTRLDRRDGKSHYLRHLPRLWRYMDAAIAREPALEPLGRWLDRWLPRAVRVTPPARAAQASKQIA